MRLGDEMKSSGVLNYVDRQLGRNEEIWQPEQAPRGLKGEDYRQIAQGPTNDMTRNMSSYGLYHHHQVRHFIHIC